MGGRKCTRETTLLLFVWRSTRRGELREHEQKQHLRCPSDQSRRHPDPGLRTLTARDYGAVFVRAGKDALDDHLTNLAAALAYYAFLAIPALLLVAVGAFSLFAGPDAVTSIVERLSGVIPREAVTLVHDALLRVTEQQAGAGVLMASSAWCSRCGRLRARCKR